MPFPIVALDQGHASRLPMPSAHCAHQQCAKATRHPAASFAPHRVLRRPCTTPFKPLTMGGLEVAPREAYCGPAPGVAEIHCGSVEAAPMQVRSALLSI
ncbi:hypothetical protein LdCL_300020000 [Leishmania donovani]|uniref:Uncharacterized protein n=1 Tax=Leishmania donovani TaxID=5661 RepID=A0A3S7X3D7_LEIDO|nr:hypothetical protein LdCL_300020000 [Leishmania donovani]